MFTYLDIDLSSTACALFISERLLQTTWQSNRMTSSVLSRTLPAYFPSPPLIGLRAAGLPRASQALKQYHQTFEPCTTLLYFST